MPKAPARSTKDAEQPTPAPAGSDEPTADSQDGVARLAATLQELQTRHDGLLHRFLNLIEERRALDRALFAERFKTAGLQRDLGVFQRQWHAAKTELTEIRAQNDHHKQLCLDLQQQVRETRAQQDQHDQVNRSLNEGLQQQLAEMQAQRDHQRQMNEGLQQQLREAQAQRDRQVQMNKDLQKELHDIRHSRIWLLGQKYWNLSRRVKGR